MKRHFHEEDREHRDRDILCFTKEMYKGHNCFPQQVIVDTVVDGIISQNLFLFEQLLTFVGLKKKKRKI